MDLDLTGKVAIITGPAKGMGAAITHAFAAEGVHVGLFGRDVAAIQPVAESCLSLGVTANVVKCDVTCDEAVKAAVKEIAEAHQNQIDILINVAGGTGPIGKTGTTTTADEFDEIVHLNMRGPFNLINAVAPYMQARKSGKIVNVGGTFGMKGRAGRLAYSSSKWGLRGITKSFALELGPDNINVNCVAPGMVDGPRFRDKVIPEMMTRLNITEAEAISRHAADYALKRISTDEDVAAATLFLASEASKQITGVDLPIDGGWAAI